jgi:hypothetical protein
MNFAVCHKDYKGLRENTMYTCTGSYNGLVDVCPAPSGNFVPVDTDDKRFTIVLNATPNDWEYFRKKYTEAEYDE